MWKQSLIALVMACSLTGCKGGGVDDVVHLISGLIKLVKLGSSSDSNANAEQHNFVQAPAPETMTVVPPKYAPEILNATAKTYRSPIKYKKGTPRTIYFDAEGKLIPAAVKGGYLRQFLGKTADGREVAQDFYDDGSPQTSPFIFRQGADTNSFDSSMTDGWLLNFARSGELSGVAEYKDGKLFGVSSHYQNQQLVAQMGNVGDANVIWLLYPNGTVKAQVTENPKNNNNEILAFREDGSALGSLRFRIEGDKPVGAMALWHSDGRSVESLNDDGKEIGQQFQAVLKQLPNEVQALEE
ncbi:Uncharacterised protein [Alysiella crassa]|uniref:MORN repeat variant n=2 Tax=Alysiella crassa TaxID=153491 RepID=A0A376BKD3_9NEIS|nr:Uncharacterised protein [Alysiella crassa]